MGRALFTSFWMASIILFVLAALPNQELQAQTTITVGSGSQTNSSSTYPAPYGNFYEGAKHQMLVKASELSNAGLTAGNITEIGFEVQSASGNTLQDLTIEMSLVNQSSLSSFSSNLDTVLNPTDHTPASGWDMHTLNNPFFWDGSSDLLIETCFKNPSFDQNDEMVHTDVGYDATLYYRADGQPDICTNPGSPTASTLRPNLRITGVSNSAPDADFEGNPTVTCNGEVQFQDLSDFNPTSWKWYFGDGDSSSAQNPMHTYTSSGTYTVELIASNSNGSDTLIKTNYIDVNLSNPTPVPANCTPQTQDSLEGFGIHNVSFNTIDNNSQDAMTEGYADFTCQGTQVYEGSSYTLSMVTDTPTTHNAKAWIDYNNDGSFDPNNELVLDQESVSYPSNSFTIPTTAVIDTPLRMRVMADYDVGTPTLDPCQDPQYGQAEDYKIRVLDNPFPPVADLSVSDTLTCDGTIDFTDESQNAPTAWKWYFGDGDSSTAQNPTHTYTSSGTYTVELIVYKSGDSDTIVQQDLITVDLSGEVKAASCQPTTLSYCCDYGIYELAFNNIHRFSGSAEEGYMDFSCPSHTQVVEGNSYTIDIKTGSQNEQDTRVWIDLDSSGTFESSEMLFESLNAYDPSGTISIPGGSVQNERLRMRVSSDFAGSNLGPCDDPEKGQVEDYSVTVLPNPNPPTADFTVDSTYSCGGTVQFTDQSSNGPTDWQWDFGDGNTDTVPNPTHTYQSNGTYTVTLTASNSNGSDTEIKTDLITVSLGNCYDTAYVPTSGNRSSESCYGTLWDDGGPDDYSNSSSGTFTIAPPNANSVILEFQTFDFEFSWDSLIIYDGPSTGSPMIGAYTGTALPEGGTVQSSGPSITVQQKTDGSISEAGFLLDWSCSTGMEEKENDEEQDLRLKVHPNPSSERARIGRAGEGKLPEKLLIFDPRGELMDKVHPRGSKTSTLDVSSYASGVYLIRWVDPDKGTGTVRFLVQDR